MPRVTIPGVGDVNFPDTMSRDEIMSRAQVMQRESLQPKYDPRDLPTGELLKGGFSRGIEGLKGTALDLIPALAGSVFGQDQYAREQLKEYADRMAEAEAINPTAYKSYKDVQGLGDVIPFIAETVGELGPDALSFIGGAGAGSVIGKQIAKRGAKEISESIAKKSLTGEAAAAAEKLAIDKAKATGASIGSKTGLFGSSMAVNVPDVFQSVYETTGDINPALALAIGPIVGMLDTYLPGKILSQLGPGGKARLAETLLNKSEVVPVNWKKAFGVELAKTAAGEGATEGMQEALTIAAEQIAGDKKGFFSPQNIDRMITSSLKGAVGGTTLGGPGAALEAKRTKDLAIAEINRRAAAGEITPQEQQQLLLEYSRPPAMEQVETDQTKRPIEVTPGVIFDPKTGTYTTQEAEPALGRPVTPKPEATQGTPELVGLGAPQVDLAPAQQEMFGLTAYEQAAPSIDQALAGPPQAPAEFKTKLDADSLKGTGLKQQSGFFKQLLNKDVSKPKDQKAVAQVLAQVRSNPKIAQSTKDAVEGVAMQAFNALATQREMLTPTGRIKKEADYGRVQPRPVSGTSRKSVSVPEQLGTVPAEGVGAPERGGLAPVGGPVGEPGVREEVQQDTLTPEEQNALQAELAQTQMEGVTPPAESPAVGVPEGTNQVASVAQPEPVVQAAPTKKGKAQAPAAAPKAKLTRQEQEYLQDHILNLKAERAFVKDPAARAAIDEEIANTEADLKVSKYRVATEGLSKQFTGDVAALAKQLRNALDRMGLQKVGLNLERALTNNAGKAVEGRYANKLIEVALNANNPAYTLGHEALHAMKEMGFFSPNDWNILSRHTQSWMKKYDIAGRYPGLSQEEQMEEAIAEAFASYQQQEPQVASMFEKVLDTLQKLGNFISGLGFRSTSDIFSEASTGKLATARADAIDAFDKFLDTNINKEPKYQVAAARKVIDGVSNIIYNSPYLKDTQKTAFISGMENSSGVAKSALQALLPMHALGELADSVFPGLGSKFNSLINQRNGYQNGLNEETDGAMKELKDAIRVRPDQRKPFNYVVNQSTIYEVDPSDEKNRSKYVNKFDDNGNSKEVEFDRLRKEYIKLSPVWQQAYKTMRDAYKKMYDETIEAIELRIDKTDISSGTKKLIKADILERLAKRGVIEPYFALGREGDRWLSYTYVDADGQPQRAHEAFKSNKERSVRKAQLENAGATKIEEYTKLSEINYRNAPPGSFVNSVLQVMDVNKPVEPVNPTPEQKIAYEKSLKSYEDSTNEIMRLFISTLPETAFAKSFQKRTGAEGYMEDTIGVFERKIRNMIHQISNMRYNPQLTDTVNQMEEYSKAVGNGTVPVVDNKGNPVLDAQGKPAFKPARNNETEVAYTNEFKKHLSYVLNPTKSDVGSILNSGAFTYLLGFNVSSALVNLANIPMIVAPYLKGKYSDAAVSRAIGDATKLFTGSGIKTKMEVLGGEGRTTDMDVMPSINNYAPDSEMGKRYATAIKVWNEHGQLNRSQLYEILNGDTRTGLMAKFNAASGWMFHHGERMNREVTLVATYNLELDRLKKQGITGQEAEIKAANEAMYINELTNGGIAAAAAPRFAQNPVGKMVFMFKRYGVSMYYLMFKTFKQATQGNTPEERRAAWQQLGGIVGMSALMAGAQGIPMYGALSLLYSMFCDDDDEDFDTVTRKYLGEFVYKGPIEYATNLAIANRITLNDLIVRDTKGGSNAGTFSQQLLQALGGPVIGVADRISRGYSKINEGYFMRGMEDLLPSAIANGLKGIRYATEGTTTLRGDPITGDVSAYNAVAQMFGFAPADYTRQLEINATEKGIDKTLSERSSKLKQKYYMAKRNGDTEGMADVKEKLLEMGTKHPELGINQGTVKGILDRSMKAQERATKEMLHGVRYNKKRLAEVKASLAEYED